MLSILCIVLLLLSPPFSQAQIADRVLVQSCEGLLSRRIPGWRVAPVTAEVAEFARRRNVSATLASGDFDADGRTDVAMLILGGVETNPIVQRLEDLHIAVCLNTTSGVRLYMIDKPYCGDGIAVSRRGTRYHDFESGSDGVYTVDGVHAYCFEKAGATYQYESDAFRMIVDSD